MALYRNLRLVERVGDRASSATDTELKAMFRTAVERWERTGEPVARAALREVVEEMITRRMPPPPA